MSRALGRILKPLGEALAWGVEPAAAVQAVHEGVVRGKDTRARRLAQGLVEATSRGRALSVALADAGAPAEVRWIVGAGEESGDLRAAGRAILRLDGARRGLRHGLLAALALPTLTMMLALPGVAALARVFTETPVGHAAGFGLARGLMVAFAAALALVAGLSLWPGAWSALARLPGLAGSLGRRQAAASARLIAAHVSAGRTLVAALEAAGLPGAARAVDGGVALPEAIGRSSMGRWLAEPARGALDETLPTALAEAAEVLEAEADARQRVVLAWTGHVTTAVAAVLVATMLVYAYGGFSALPDQVVLP